MIIYRLYKDTRLLDLLTMYTAVAGQYAEPQQECIFILCSVTAQHWISYPDEWHRESQ